MRQALVSEAHGDEKGRPCVLHGRCNSSWDWKATTILGRPAKATSNEPMRTRVGVTPKPLRAEEPEQVATVEPASRGSQGTMLMTYRLRHT
jgi:hypothetical protein